MKVSFKNDELPDGTELYVRGLGTLKNGKTVEFSKEQISAFEEQRGISLGEAFKNNPNVELSGAGSKGGDV